MASASSDRVSRFAPSPTGYLHLGHALSALTAEAAAGPNRFLVRVEDIDRERCRPEYEAAIFEDLAWLGLDWEQPVRRQSEHLDDYEAALARLREAGLLYRCFRTRKEVLDEIVRAPHGPGEVFTGAALPPDEEERRLEAGDPFAWRLSLAVARAALGEAFEALTFVEEGAGPGGEHGVIAARPQGAGDVVLARKGLGVAYHLAVVVDDALQGVDVVVRGQDLFEATSIQRLLQALLGLPTTAYRHHRILVGPEGQRFAKRDRAQTLRSLRERGVTAAEVRERLGFAR